MDLKKYYKEIKCEQAVSIFSKARKLSEKNFLLESLDISHIYGRLSLIGIDPVLEIVGKNDQFKVSGLNSRARYFLEELSDEDFDFCDEFQRFANEISGAVIKDGNICEEENRTRKKNISLVVRLFLEKFRAEKRVLLGLYGAFAYDFIRLFENIPEILSDEGIPDFRLCLYDTFILFDHLKGAAEIITFRENGKIAEEDIEKIFESFDKEDEGNFEFKIENAEFDLSEDEYKALVDQARELAKEGELFEVVYSNTLRSDFSGEPFALYCKYREINPSPYLFYFDFGDEQILGASPEMMVRCEDRQVHMRPISGTAKRGADPIEDHENMLKLLQDPKERAELDMLIDLGRNDLARICEAGIKISDYRFVEKYSKVMHTVAHLSGKLRPEFSALDALIACLNAGTLTGAPKVAAMTEIEKNENSRRGYYGGAIGYLSFSGEMDTGIIIRSAHIKNGKLNFRVGATLLYDSVPEAEYQEIMNKAAAFLSLTKNV